RLSARRRARQRLRQHLRVETRVTRRLLDGAELGGGAEASARGDVDARVEREHAGDDDVDLARRRVAAAADRVAGVEPGRVAVLTDDGPRADVGQRADERSEGDRQRPDAQLRRHAPGALSITATL